MLYKILSLNKKEIILWSLTLNLICNVVGALLKWESKVSILWNHYYLYQPLLLYHHHQAPSPAVPLYLWPHVPYF